MITLPLVATPVTTPVLLFTVAILTLLLDQVPPAGEPDNARVLPEQTFPEFAAIVTVGGGFTVTVAETLAAGHPVGPCAIMVNVDVCGVPAIFISAADKASGVNVPPGPVGSIPIKLALFVRVQL